HVRADEPQADLVSHVFTSLMVRKRIPGSCQVEGSSWISVGPMSVAEPADRSPFRGYRLPPEIIAHGVWLYFRFHLSFRDVQDLLAERGIIVSHETIRAWCSKFGSSYAAGLRRRRARAGDKWRLDEVALKIRGKRH